jgi:hypothetical protein
MWSSSLKILKLGIEIGTYNRYRDFQIPDQTFLLFSLDLRLLMYSTISPDFFLDALDICYNIRLHGFIS